MPLDDLDFQNSNKPHPTHLWFFRSAIMLLIISLLLLFLKKGAAVDIQMHDTYFVIALFHLALVCSIYLFFASSVYAVFDFFGKKEMHQLSSKIHYYFTTLSIAGILFCSLFLQHRIYGLSAYGKYSYINNAMTILFGFFLLAQILFLINVIRTVFISIFGKNK